MHIATTEMQIIMFRLGGEEYGIDTTYVPEIIRIPEINRLPNFENYILGICKLRDAIVPVIDLKMRNLKIFDSLSNESRILIIEVDAIKLGLLVDEVCELIKLPSDSINLVPPKNFDISSDYLMGTVKYNQRTFGLVDANKLL